MSRRGRATGAAISLFSFQDIITSVTAIMILLVLILTLELVTRSQQRGVAAEDRRVARDLRAAVEALERRAEVLRTELAALQSSVTRSASFSEAETRDRERLAADRAAALAEELDLLTSQLRTATLARRRTEAELVTEQSAEGAESAGHVAAMEARAQEMEAANRAERERQKQARTAADGSVAPTFVFNAAAGSTLEPRLVEVAGDGLAVLVPGGGQPRRFRGLGGDFTRWLAGLDPRSEYVVLILRPSGIGSFDAVKDRVKARGLEVGAELVGESTTVALGGGG